MKLPQNILRRIRNKSFKSVAILLSGTLFSQLLPIAFFPVLSRMYSPADYGALGIFMSIALVLTSIANFQLNNAILLPEAPNEAKKVVLAGIYVAGSFTAITFFLLILLNWAWSMSNDWLFLLPVGIFIAAANLQLYSWFTRCDDFKIVTRGRIVTSIATILCSLGFYFLINGPGALILSYCLGQCAACFFLTRVFLLRDRFQALSWLEIKEVLVANRKFIFFTTPTELINNFSQQLPIYIFSIYAGAQSVGWFSRSRQILALPINYLSASIAEVYKQRSSEIYRKDPAALRSYFLKTSIHLLFFSFFPFLILAIFAPELFAFFLGEPWRMAGVYSQVLALMYFFKFIVSPTTFNFFLAGKQGIDFALHFGIIALTALSMFVGLYFYGDELVALILFAISYSLVYVLYGILSYRFTLQIIINDKDGIQ